MADDAMEDANYYDVFQLPTAMLPVLPMLSSSNYDKCMPCDDVAVGRVRRREQWRRRRRVRRAIRRSADSHSYYDPYRHSYQDPVCRGQRVCISTSPIPVGRRPSYESDSDGEPPPPPVKPAARLARRSPSASRAATRPTSVSDSIQVVQITEEKGETLFSREGTMPDRRQGPGAGAGCSRGMPARDDWRFRSAAAL